MKKKILNISLILLTLLFATACGGDKNDPYETDDDTPAVSDDDTFEIPDGEMPDEEMPDEEMPDHNNDPIKDCNYSSTDNRLRPKNEELLFSGIIYGERSLTKYIYIMNRCYNCGKDEPLVISKISIVDAAGEPDEGSFKIESDPIENGPVSLQNDEEIGIGVSVVASTWKDQVRYLRIESNDKCKPAFDIKLTAQTKATGKIAVKTLDEDPDDDILVFTDVLDELIEQVEISNEGTAYLKLSSVVISEGQSKNANEMGFFIHEGPEPGLLLLPEETVTVNVGCRNDKEYPSPLSGELRITNTDPTNYGENAEKKIALKCGPNVEKSPTAVLKCQPDQVSVFQWATMDGSASVDSDGESKSGLRYLWSFSSTPGGISLDIVDDSNRGGTPLNGDPSNKISRAAFQSKIKGNYVVRLIVINEQGVSSVPAECTVEAVSDDDLAVKLLWNNKNADMDLHLIRPDGEFGNAESDCYYWNCSPQYSGEKPDWGEIGESKDDPNLDIDNTDGIGPETVTINKPANGTYKVVVHAYDTSKGPTTAVVKAYAHSTEKESVSLLMNKTDTCWDVYTIEVSDGSDSKKNIKIKAITPAVAYDCERPKH